MSELPLFSPQVCGRSYSFVPVYSENAPERLPCNEFLIGVLLRVARYMKLIVPWIVVFLFNTYCNSLHPLGQVLAAEFQRDFWFASLWAGLVYIILIVCFMTIITLIRVQVEEHNVRRFPGGFHADILIGNGLPQGVIAGVLQVLWKYTKILCDWYFVKFVHFMGRPPGRLIFVPLNVPLDEFGVLRRMLFFLDEDAFAVSSQIFVCASLLFLNLPKWRMLSNKLCWFPTGSCHQRICVYPLCSSAIFDWMDCFSNYWRQLFIRKLTCYSWIHDDVVNSFCLLWYPLHSSSILISSHSPVVFARISLHSSEISMSLVGFHSKSL